MHRPVVAPDFVRCNETAGVLLRMQLPRKLVRQRLFGSDRRTVGNFNLLLVAICHQTQGASGKVDGQWCRGWDYLERRLNAHCRSAPDFLEIANWAPLSREELERALAPSTCDLPDLDARTALINDLGHHMLEAGHTSFEQLYESAKRRCRGEHSMLSFLRATAAYSDPNEKKARLLIGLLRDAHGWEFADAHELGAPVDYHEIRGHLRIGTVVVGDCGLKARIQADKISAHDDNLIRAAISDAIAAIAGDLPGVDSLQVHYMLWNYFRALCRRHQPICREGGEISEAELDPAYFESFRMDATAGGCAFSAFCDAFRTQVFPVEYRYSGSFY